MERSTSGFVERYSSSLPQEDVKGFGEFLHEWNPQTVPKVRSYEEDERLKIPLPDFVLGPEHSGLGCMRTFAKTSGRPIA